ncbi:MAG TPA: NAD-dependent epimerase/dehydratase family protein [Rhizomicrobium sp.]|nr:NAD-dependent epimerase/dehydratase family protein [Rhizomicrobium sp.]
MRVLVVGGTRFIGARVAAGCAARGCEVTVFHRGRTQSPLLPPSVTYVRDPAAEYPILGFPEALKRDWDAVIHMVAMGEADAHAAVDAFAGRAGRLVLISSGDVYRAYGRLTRKEPGPPDPVPLTEDAPLRSVLYPYGRQDYEKILAERVVMASELSWTILRLPKVYGPEDNANLATIYMAAAHPQWRWTHGHVDNVAAAIVLAATSEKAHRRVYNVGEETTPTTAERLACLPPPPHPYPAPDFDFAQSIAYDTSRIRGELGYREIVDERAAMAAGVSDTR